MIITSKHTFSALSPVAMKIYQGPNLLCNVCNYTEVETTARLYTMATSVIPESVCTADSLSLAELSTIFPNIEYNVLVSVLQANNGQMNTTVEYLIVNPNTAEQTSDECTDYELQEMIGQFSEDIGGLPEMLPSFLFDVQDTLCASDEDSSVTHSQSPSPDSDVNSEDDPLPTYEEACTDQDRLPDAVYIEDEVEGGVLGVENTVAIQEPVAVPVTSVQSNFQVFVLFYRKRQN